MPFDFRTAQVGDRVQGSFLVRDRTERTTRDSSPFVVLTLANASGTIDTAPFWSSQLDWCQGADPGRVVEVTGEITTYGDDRKRQLTVKAPLRVQAGEEVNPEDFLARIEYPYEKLWDSIDKLRSSLQSAKLRAAVDLFFADDSFRVLFDRTPGAVRGHHAKLGGLLLHVVEVATIARNIARTVRPANADLAIAGALLHDVGKVEAYSISETGFGYTPTGILLGHVVLGALMFERRLNDAQLALSEAQRLELLHMILSHHGSLEFGSPVQPMTPEAGIVHWADEASAKTTDFFDEMADPALFPVGSDNEVSLKRSWRLQRNLWRRPAEWD